MNKGKLKKRIAESVDFIIHSAFYIFQIVKSTRK
jgi:hypothetical protein